ncbi:IS4 family transposase [Streptomyces mirabilis]|uniref:IS4 family transposase n=1 Tax=Streptomyces mirabilis TaxID=68239 RepID=UPI0022522E4C|nr:IS4 family transposase [Streptomyces mirabilis]MCX5355935.1 IS4 family transposase [Streptomyces mirabilis]
MLEKSVITRTIETARGVFAPGHLGELTQIVDFALVDAVLEETRAVQRRVRLLPARVVVYFILALALFEDCSYRAVWGKLTAGLVGLPLVSPHASSLSRARRRLGAEPLRVLFETLAGTVATRSAPGVWWCGMRTVAFDGTGLQLPDRAPVTGRFPKRSGAVREFGYPLMRLVTLVETGTRAIIAAAFGPESDGELPYAIRLLDRLEANMLVLADAGFDAIGFLRGIHATGAQFLVRSSATRRPLVQDRLPDGSYLTRLSAPYRTGHGYGLLTVRVIEAWITVKLADGTVRREQWRLITSLTDPALHPARRLVTLYHERWQAETCYASVKATLLDGRVLRSGHPADLDQEVWGILTVYQALIHTAADAATHRPGLDMDRLSFTVALNAARDQVTTASGILPSGTAQLVGTIGRALLDNLLPTHRRQRLKARSLKSHSKYAPNTAQHPATAQTYTFHTEIAIMEKGLAPRSHR